MKSPAQRVSQACVQAELLHKANVPGIYSGSRPKTQKPIPKIEKLHTGNVKDSSVWVHSGALPPSGSLNIVLRIVQSKIKAMTMSVSILQTAKTP